jgi:hypothetical protein
VIGLALRTIVRYVVPLAAITFVVSAPLFAIAFRAPWPFDLKTANAAMLRASAIALGQFAIVFVLVAAAAPLVRSVAAGTPLSQVRAFVGVFANVLRMLVPCLAAIAAVVVGGLALVVPALVLIVLLSLTGASTERGMPAPLAESVATVRARWKPVTTIVVVMVVVEIVLVVAAWKFAAVPATPKLKPAQWATYGNVARIVALGVAATAPVFATLLAAVRRR